MCTFLPCLVYFKVLAYTAKIALQVTLICTGAGYPVAYFLTNAPPQLRTSSLLPF